MKKATKAALLSGLVYPGVGQMVLGRPGAGIAFIIATTAGIAMIIRGIMSSISVIMDQAVSMMENGGMNYNKVFQLSMNVSRGNSLLLNLAPTLLLLCWVGAIVHAYVIGSSLDKTANGEQPPPKPPPLS